MVINLDIPKLILYIKTVYIHLNSGTLQLGFQHYAPTAQVLLSLSDLDKQRNKAVIVLLVPLTKWSCFSISWVLTMIWNKKLEKNVYKVLWFSLKPKDWIIILITKKNEIKTEGTNWWSMRKPHVHLWMLMSFLNVRSSFIDTKELWFISFIYTKGRLIYKNLTYLKN